MASELRPLNVVLRELNALLAKKASGFLFIVTDDDRSASIRLREGRIDEVGFKNRYNDEAVQLLSHVVSARARFQPSATTQSKRVPLGELSMRWLLGGYEELQIPPSSSQPGASAADSASHGPPPRQIIEDIALNYFGPIASLLCDEAFSSSGEIEQILRQISLNLPDPDEADRFVAEARAALAKAT